MREKSANLSAFYCFRLLRPISDRLYIALCSGVCRGAEDNAKGLAKKNFTKAWLDRITARPVQETQSNEGRSTFINK
jgi:hypothetical protein